METYITYNAGCNIWEVEPFNENIEWHNDKDVYKGTKKECEAESKQQMKPKLSHYPNAPYRSIWDY